MTLTSVPLERRATRLAYGALCESSRDDYVAAGAVGPLLAGEPELDFSEDSWTYPRGPCGRGDECTGILKE